MITDTRRAFVVTDLGYGDFSKGATVEFLTHRHRAHVNVRFSGGAQAAHNIVRADGVHHTFSQFGSGTFEGARTHLSRFMVVHPGGLAVEAEYLQRKGISDPYALLTVDRRALVITPFHQALNRIAELHRGAGAHGSCGIGVGMTVGDSYDHPDDAVRMGDLTDSVRLTAKLRRIQDRLVAVADQTYPWTPGLPQQFLAEREALRHTDVREYVSAMGRFQSNLVLTDDAHWSWLTREPGTMVFENAQGVALDEWHGFHPNTTYTNTTHDNALTLLREVGYDGKVTRLGGLRTYQTRHGQGVFMTETPNVRHHELHNSPRCWQGAWRQGHMDTVLARYAIEACGGVDGLVLSHLDCVAPGWNACTHYEDSRKRTYATLPVNPERVVNGYQEGNTALLRDLTAQYLHPQEGATQVRPEDVLAFVEASLGSRVVLGSYGPTLADRVLYDQNL